MRSGVEWGVDVRRARGDLGPRPGDIVRLRALDLLLPRLSGMSPAPLAALFHTLRSGLPWNPWSSAMPSLRC
jgi:hypothetical protein